jgi:hypothetical protein
MSLKCKIAVGIAVSLLAVPALATPCDVEIYFMPDTQNASVGDTIDWDIYVDINDATPILGWEMDLDIMNGAVASFLPPATVGGDFAQVSTDGDGLGGLYFPPNPGDPGLSGVGILLATVSLSADAVGMTDVDLVMGDDFGFLFDGPDGTVCSTPGLLIVPEPASLLLLALAGLIRRR